MLSWLYDYQAKSMWVMWCYNDLCHTKLIRTCKQLYYSCNLCRTSGERQMYNFLFLPWSMTHIWDLSMKDCKKIRLNSALKGIVSKIYTYVCGQHMQHCMYECREKLYCKWKIMSGIIIFWSYIMTAAYVMVVTFFRFVKIFIIDAYNMDRYSHYWPCRPNKNTQLKFESRSNFCLSFPKNLIINKVTVA